MRARSLLAILALAFCALGAASNALALANRVFVSARSGNDANSCDDVNAPCKTFAGAVIRLNRGGEAIVLDSGGYGPVTITQGVTIEAPAGVTAFIRPPSGDAITINAAGATVTLRGLVLNGGVSRAIIVNSVGTLNVESCSIAGFASDGIVMSSAGRLNLKGTDIKGCFAGLVIANSSGLARVSIDHCHLDENNNGYVTATISPGSSTATANYTTANNNSNTGWISGSVSTGKDLLSLEFCTGTENGFDGLSGNSGNATSVVRYSNCVFANNGQFGVSHPGSGNVESRGNNTIWGNVSGSTSGTIGTFFPL